MEKDRLWSNRTLWYKLHSPCLEEEEGWAASQEHHAHCEAWGWNHHGLGKFFCKGGRTTDLCEEEDERIHGWRDFWQKSPPISENTENGSPSRTMIPNTSPWQRRSGYIKNISRFWSVLARIWTNRESAEGVKSPKTCQPWSRSAWWNGPNLLKETFDLWHQRNFTKHRG